MTFDPLPTPSTAHPFHDRMESMPLGFLRPLGLDSFLGRQGRCARCGKVRDDLVHAPPEDETVTIDGEVRRR
jgi:hypothetical protein